MKKTERAILYDHLFEAYYDYAIEPNTTYSSYYFLGFVHGIDRAINIIDHYDYLSNATHEFMTELIKAKKGGEN